MAVDRDKALNAAQKLVAKRQFEAAIVQYRKVLKDQPGDERIQMRIADLQLRMSAHEAAIETLMQVGTSYDAQGFTVKAIAVYKQAQGVVQQHLPARSELLASIVPKLAGLYEKQGLKGDAAHAWDELAGVFQRAGRTKDELEALRKLVALRGDDWHVRARLVEALFTAGDTQLAIAELGALAEQHRSSGRRSEAIEAYERMLASREEPGVSRSLAELYLERNSPGDAVAALQRLQQCFASTQRDAATLAVLARALDAVGQRPRATDTRKLLLKTLMEASDLRAARELVSKLLIDAPGDESVRQAAVKLGILRPAPAAVPRRAAMPSAPTLPTHTPEPPASPPPQPVPDPSSSPPGPAEESLVDFGALERESFESELRDGVLRAFLGAPEGAGPQMPPPTRLASAAENESNPSPVPITRFRRAISAPLPREEPSEPPDDLEPTVRRQRRRPSRRPVEPAPRAARNEQERLPRDERSSRRSRSKAPERGSELPEPTMPFRREELDELESPLPSPDTTLRLRPEELAELQLPVEADTTMPFRRDELAESDVASAPIDPTMPSGKDLLDGLEASASEAAGGGEDDTEQAVGAGRPESAEEREAVADTLEEVAFYEAQKLFDDALSLVEEQLAQFPDNRLLLGARRRLRSAQGAGDPSDAPPQPR